MSRYVDVDIKIEISGPAKGAIARAILAILAVGIRHGRFVETSDFYRVCLEYSEDYEKELEDLAGVYIPIGSKDLYKHMWKLACMANCSHETYYSGEEAGRYYVELAVFEGLGLQISYGDYIFCLTLFKKYWNVNYEYVREGKLGIYITNPRIEVLGVRIK